MMKIIDFFLVFIKGLLMGICDIIPGISGGTVAFITGIYSRLINAVKGLSFGFVKDFFLYLKDKNILKFIKKYDLIFLVVLAGGIGTAFLIMSRIIKYLLENQFSNTISFFIGLIIFSAIVIFKKIRDHRVNNLVFGLVGIVIGVIISLTSPLSVQPTLPYIFLGGFLAISAMFLPGISGAFILLLLGMYEFLLGVIHELTAFHNISLNFKYFIVFIFGALLGAFSISRIISFLFKRDKYKTLYTLLGLVVGSLLLPIRRVLDSTHNEITFGMTGFLFLGMVIAFLITRIEKHKIIDVNE